MQPVVIPAGRPPLHLVFAAVALVAGSVLLIVTGKVAYGVAGVAFFGLGLIVFMVQAVRAMLRRPVLVIDEEGYLDRTSFAGPGRVAWSQVRRAHIMQESGQRFLALEVVDPQAILDAAPAWRRWLMRANMSKGYAPLNIVESALPFPLETLIEIIRTRNPGLEVQAPWPR